MTYTALLCQGKTPFEAVKEMNDDLEYYCCALGISKDIPSPETLRQRMDDMGSSMRNESKESRLEIAKENCKNPDTPRKGKTVYVGSIKR